MSVTLMGRHYPSARVVKVKGSRKEMGRQHGEQLRDLLVEYKASTDLSYRRAGYSGETLRKALELNEIELERSWPELIEELRAVAEGAKIPYFDVLSMYLCPEIVSAQPLEVVYRKHYETNEDACTAFGAWGKATKDEAPLLAQTRDTSPSGVKYRVTVIAEPEDGYSYVAHSRPTLNGGYGVNSRGISMVAPTVYVSDSVAAINSGKPSGITDSTLSKIVMEKCASVDEALRFAEQKPGGYMGLNIVFVDNEGNVARVERSYGSVNTRFPEIASYSTNFVVAAANHFSSREMNRLGPSDRGKYPSSYHRYDRIMELLTANAGQITIEVLKNFSRDHSSGPGDLSICRHGEAICTNSAIIIEPRQRRLHVLTGTPCQNEYTRYECPS